MTFVPWTERYRTDDHADRFTDLLENRSMTPFKKYATLLLPHKIDLAPFFPARRESSSPFLQKTRADRRLSWRGETDHKLRPRSSKRESWRVQRGNRVCNLALIHRYIGWIEKTGIRKDQKPILCTWTRRSQKRSLGDTGDVICFIMH